MHEDMPAEKRAREGRAKGGRARARVLAPGQRKRIASKAARERWNPSIPVAEYGSKNRAVKLGDLELPCYVLTGGIRVFSQRGLLNALALQSRGSIVHRFIELTHLERHLPPDAANEFLNPIHFRVPGGGRTVYGYPATLLIDICNAVSEAAADEDFPKFLSVVAKRCEFIVRAVAKVGIIALVDEATGYDQNREETLQAILELFLQKELAAWMQRFPNEYYEQICRLKGWSWNGRPGPTPWAIARMTTDLVYSRLAPGIVAELEKLNPRLGGRRRHKHHQFLTADIGHPALAQHLHTLISFMVVSDSWDQFIGMVNKALPPQDDSIQLRLLEWRGTNA